MAANSGYIFKGSDEYTSQEGKRRRQHSLFVKVLAVIIILLILLVVGVVVGVVVSKNKSQNSATLSSSTSSSGGKSTTGQTTGITNGSNDPSVFEKDPNLHKSFYGMAYTPEGSMMPNCSNSLENVIKDIQLLSQLTTRVRLYGADCNQTALVLEAIKQTKVEMEVFVGIYVLPNNNESYIRQRDIVKDAIQTYGVDHIAGVTVGNEFMLNYISEKQESDPNSAIGNEGAAMLIAYIEDTRNMLAGLSLPKTMPVGNSDAGSYFNTKVLSSVDYGASTKLYLLAFDSEYLFFPSYLMCTLGLRK
ncbi:hypothetical protein H2248_006588 [Termitomyces sp. 'cryptogamus']|nr:hypothetical protein H2248_006588 [Termitomyces sp. 'cryptogamus']